MSENDIVIELLRLINTDLFIYLQSRGDTPARACAGYAPERTAQWKFGKVLAQSVKFPQTCSISFDAEKFRKEALEWTGCGIPPRGIFVENLCSFKHNILLFCHWFNLTLYRSNIINVYLTSYIVVVRFYTPPPPSDPLLQAKENLPAVASWKTYLPCDNFRFHFSMSFEQDKFFLIDKWAWSEMGGGGVR